MATRFGTTSDMVIQEIEENGEPRLLAIDARGLYLTGRQHLDSRLADPNRFSTLRQETAGRLQALGLDAAALQSANQHLVKAESGEAAKKVNPLKASKRKMKSA